MMFGHKTEGGRKNLKNFLRLDKNPQRNRRPHDLGYRLNLQSNQMPNYFQSDSYNYQESPMISVNTQRQVPMNYPIGQHISHPSQARVPTFNPQETPWELNETNCNQQNKCSCCRRAVPQILNRSKCSCRPVYNARSEESHLNFNPGNCRHCEDPGHTNYREREAMESRFKSCKCKNCPDDFPPRGHICNKPNVQYKTHENCCKCQNQKCTYDHKFGQNLRQNTNKCTYEPKEEVRMKQEPCCSRANKCSNNSPKTSNQKTFISNFTCPNCSFSCILNINKSDSKEQLDRLEEQAECDECINFVEPEIERNQCDCDQISESLDHGDSNCDESSERYKETLVVSKDNFVNCINPLNPVLNIQAYENEPKPNVFLNVVQKEEVIWFSS